MSQGDGNSTNLPLPSEPTQGAADLDGRGPRLNALLFVSDQLHLMPLRACLDELPEIAWYRIVHGEQEATRVLAEVPIHAIYFEFGKALSRTDSLQFVQLLRTSFPHAVFVLYVRRAPFLENLETRGYPPEWCDRLRHYFILDKETPLADFDLAVRDSVKAVLFDLKRMGAQWLQDESVGRVLGGRYLVLEQAGSGGQGTVYKARQMGTEQLCALKLMRPDLDERDADRLRREAQLTAQIAHPNVVRIIDFDRDETTGRHFLVAEFLSGMTLAQALTKERRLPPARAAKITSQIAWGITAAHTVGVLHRDLKPANVMLRRLAGIGDHAVVMDFGLGKRVDRSLVGEASQVAGTPDYMAPEQITLGELGPYTDVYALAACAYEMLSGHKPFPGTTPEERFRAKMQGPPIELSLRCPELAGIGAGLDACFMRGLARGSAERTTYPIEFAEQLARALSAS